MAFVFWLLARDGHDEHGDLYGSGHRSVTPYVHGKKRVALLKSGLTSVSEDSIAYVVFYSSKPRQLHSDPGPNRWHQDNLIYCIGSRYLGEANDVFNGMEVVTPCRPATSLACATRYRVVGSLGTVVAWLPRVVKPPRTIVIHCKWDAGLRCSVAILQSPAHTSC
jgi:hypothetical protein